MSRLVRITLILVILAAALSTVPAKAQADPSDPTCTGSGGYFVYLPSGEQYCIFVPPVGWNGDLVVFAHGYVFYGQPLEIPWDQLILQDGTNIPYLITSMGYAFAITSYEKTGLAVKEGVNDILQLVDFVNAYLASQGLPVNHVYIVGVSEGGLVTTLAVEQHPDVFSGGLAACGPIGDFTKQVNYWGDFRVVFDYFFPGVLEPTAVNIPASYLEPGYWDSVLVPSIVATISNPENYSKVTQLLNVTNAPIDIADPSTIGETVLGILSYNIFATDEARTELYGRPVQLNSNQGQPFDNRTKLYSGSSNDFLLNLKVDRFTAVPKTLSEISSYYQTSGMLQVPLITLHNTGDPIVPYWHETLYGLKTQAMETSMYFKPITVSSYGHCNFDATEAMAAFFMMIADSAESSAVQNETLAKLPPEVNLQEFEKIIDQYNVPSSK